LKNNFDYTDWRQTQPWYNEDNLKETGRKAAEFAREYEKSHKMPPFIDV
jgi:hypothetical protein